MRNPALVVVLLVLFGIVPIVAVAAMGVATLDAAGWDRLFGRAFTVLLAPFGFAGLLMILGAAMLNRTRRAGRIVATVGAGLIFAGTAMAGIFWLERAERCVDGSHLCFDRVVEGVGLLVYAFAHIGLTALIWRARRGEMPSAV